MPPGSDTGASELHELALQKLVRVFGEPRARGLLEQVLAEIELTEVRSPADLHRVGEILQKRGGFEATVGAMFVVQAILRGM